jgi:hypothetical protein
MNRAFFLAFFLQPQQLFVFDH